jgi:hypothetical protein
VLFDRKDATDPHTVGFDIRRVTNEPDFAQLPGEADGIGRDFTMQKYSALHHLEPIFWLPLYESGEGRGGATVLGRDPLGLVSWRLTGWYGDGSGQPELYANLVQSAFPWDLSLALSHEWTLERYRYFNPVSGQVETGSGWLSRLDGSATFSRTFRFDGGGWYRSVLPWFGYITRERHQYVGWISASDVSIRAQPRRGHSVRGGVALSMSRGAARDPVPRWQRSISIRVEEDMGSLSELDGRLASGSIRIHVPGPMNGTVFAFTGNGQFRRSTLFSYSRGSVLPAGIGESDLHGELAHAQLLGRGGLEFHMPLLFPDWGPGTGAFHLDRVTGMLFAESLSGLYDPENRPVPFHGGWSRTGTVSTAGAELALYGWAIYEAPVSLRAGVALRLDDHEVSSWVSFGAPFDLVTGMAKNLQEWMFFGPQPTREKAR